MKILVIGGTGLIGSRLVNNLRAHGHEVLAASPKTGVNNLTGEGLATAMDGASVVVDVSNSPSPIRRSRYAGAVVAQGTLVAAGPNPSLGAMHFEDFLRNTTALR